MTLDPPGDGPLVLAIDNGSQSTKVALVDAAGRVVASGRRQLRPYAHPAPGHVVHPDDDLWDSIVAACREVLDAYRDRIDASDIVDRLGLTKRGYFLVSAHREENVDSPDRLRMLLDCLIAVRDEFKLPIFVSTHPRTRKRLEALPDWLEPEGITFSEPLGFHDYNKLQLSAACVLSDSGTIAEESSILGFPAITLRDSIERPEALDAGAIVMTGLDAEDVVAAIRVMTPWSSEPSTTREAPSDYLIRNTSERAAKFIISTARRHHAWASIRSSR